MLEKAQEGHWDWLKGPMMYGIGLQVDKLASKQVVSKIRQVKAGGEVSRRLSEETGESAL